MPFFAINPVNPLHNTVSPRFQARRRKHYATLDTSPADASRTKRAQNAAQVRHDQATTRYGSATLLDFEADPKTGALRQTGQAPAIVDRRTGRFTGFTLATNGLLVAEPPRQGGPLIIPGVNDQGETPDGTSATTALILPGAANEATKASASLLKPAAAMPILQLGDPTIADDAGLNALLLQVHRTQRKFAQQGTGKSRRGKP
jgi:hypothetical protein